MLSGAHAVHHLIQMHAATEELICQFLKEEISVSTRENTKAKSTETRRARVNVPADVRHKMVADAAYYIAERRGFQDGDPIGDWIAAEAEIDELLTDTVSTSKKRTA